MDAVSKMHRPQGFDTYLGALGSVNKMAFWALFKTQFRTDGGVILFCILPPFGHCTLKGGSLIKFQTQKGKTKIFVLSLSNLQPQIKIEP